MQSFFHAVKDGFAKLQEQDANRNSSPGSPGQPPLWARSLFSAPAQGTPRKKKVQVPVPDAVHSNFPDDDEPSVEGLVWTERWPALEEEGYTSEEVCEAVKRGLRKLNLELVRNPPGLPPPPSYHFVYDLRRVAFARAVQLEVDAVGDRFGMKEGREEITPVMKEVYVAIMKSMGFSESSVQGSEASLIDFWMVYCYHVDNFIEEELKRPPFSALMVELRAIRDEIRLEETREKMADLTVNNLRKEVARERAEEGAGETLKPLIESWVKFGEEKLGSLFVQPQIPRYGISDMEMSVLGGDSVTDSPIQASDSLKDDDLDEFEKELGLKL